MKALRTVKRTQRGATPMKGFQPELASVETKTNRQRWLDYQAKLAAHEVAA